MKCKTCGCEIPAGKNYCPGCGRVLSKIEQEQATPVASVNQPRPSATSPAYRRPVTTDTSAMSENIKAIFSADADAPAYHDPHTYKTATAHALEYDRNYVQRKTPVQQERVAGQPVIRNTQESPAPQYVDDTAETRKFTPVQTEYNQPESVRAKEEEYYYDDEEEKTPKFKINPTYLLICIIAVVGLVIICIGGYRIGKQFGLWGEDEKIASSGNDEKEEKEEESGDKAPVVDVPEINPDVDEVADYKIGTYTVDSKDSNILLYKNSSLDQIIATIPNLTVVEITEISEECGKCKFGTYTGWLDMKQLKYTPNAKLPEEITTVEVTTEAETTTEAEITTESETTTVAVTEPLYSTGTYVVNLQNDGYMLNVRSNASINSDIVTQLSDGDVVSVSSIDGEWGFINTSDGYAGWVYMIYLSKQ